MQSGCKSAAAPRRYWLHRAEEAATPLSALTRRPARCALPALSYSDARCMCLKPELCGGRSIWKS